MKCIHFADHRRESAETVLCDACLIRVGCALAAQLRAREATWRVTLATYVVAKVADSEGRVKDPALLWLVIAREGTTVAIQFEL